MSWVFQFVLCVVFLELFLLLRLGQEATSILTRSREGARVFTDATLDDDQKEAFMRRASVEMLKATGRLVLKIAAIGAALYLVYLLIVVLFPTSREAIVEGFTSISVIAVLTVATVGYAWARNVLSKKL